MPTSYVSCFGLSAYPPAASNNALNDVVAEFIKWEKQPPYWSNESASVSMLLVAAARAGFIAQSDYRRHKLE